jgi:hypothetical protein
MTLDRNAGFRRSRLWTSALLMSASLFVTAPQARAQMVANSFTELRSLVKPGETVYVTEANGRRTKGRLGELSTSALTLLVAKMTSDRRESFVPQTGLSERDVAQVTVERSDSIWNGMLIGAATVGVPWLIVCGSHDWCYYGESGAENMLRGAALITTAMSAGIGTLIDVSMRKRAMVYYQAPDQRSPGAQVSPFLSKEAAGIQMSWRF